MTNNLLCRIGVFYDGSYFSYAQNHFYHTRKLGWLQFRPLHTLIETFIRSKEQGFASYKVVYAAWFQGLHTTTQSDEKKLHKDRNNHHDLMHAGIDLKFLPMSESQGEKGADVALAIDALQIGNDGKMDVAVLVTGDGDMIPVVRALMKNGIRVLVAHFDYKDDHDKGYVNDRLLATCNYEMNVNQLEQDKDFKGQFKSLFRQPEKWSAVSGDLSSDNEPGAANNITSQANMRIRKIEIQGMWSFGSNKVCLDELGQHNIIIGKNNSGKSKVLDALRWFQTNQVNVADPNQRFQLKPDVMFDDGTQHPNDTRHLSVAFDFDERQRDDLLKMGSRPPLANSTTSEMMPVLAKSAFALTAKGHGDHITMDIEPSIPFNVNHFSIPGNQPHAQEAITNRWKACLQSIKAYAVRELATAIKYVGGWRTLGSHVEDNRNIIQQLHIWRDPPQNRKADRHNFDRVSALFQELMRTTNLELRPEHTGNTLHVSIQNRYLPIDSLGDGVQHLLMIAYYLATDPAALLLIEEPETHLHPELQRHLMNVMHRVSTGQTFTTTHSPVLLDAGLNSHVFRIEHNSRSSSVSRCSTPNDFREVLDLLDIRPSDILQANVAVWVEGPTDRLFLNRCLSLLNSGLTEGLDYQIVFYGGRLRSHLTFDEMPQFIDLLKLSRHAIMICDSDRKSPDDAIDDSKLRLQKECEAVGGLYWITDCREIENYIPPQTLNATYKRLLQREDVDLSLGQFDKLSDVLARRFPNPERGEAGVVNYGDNKAGIMPELLKDLTANDLRRWNLRARLESVIEYIKKAAPR